MKKKLLILAVLWGIFFGLWGYTQAQNVCDQTFYGTLRHWKGYIFSDTFNGTPNQSYYLWNFNVAYSEQYDYNNSPSFPVFAWTQQIKNQEYEVKPWQSFRVLEATSAYPIYSVPAKRSYDNLLVKYTLTYSRDFAGTKKSEHTECKYYEISWCGDGVLDTDYDEQCDPKDPNKIGRGSDGCSVDCKAKEKDKVPPVCSTDYDKKTVYNPNFPSSRLSSSMKLCNPGEVLNLKGPDVNGKYSWSCSNDGITLSSEACVAYDQRCGDGKKNGNEQCDPNDPNKIGRWSDGCSVDCKPKEKDKVPPLCSTDYDKKTQYNPNFPSSRLTSSMKLCNPGEVLNLKGPDANGKYSWSCSNDGITLSSEACVAYDQRCGDGKKNGNEQCDPNDPNKIGRGSDGCSVDCKAKEKDKVPPLCSTDYDKKTVYNPNFPSSRLSSSMKLCNPGEVLNLKGPDANGKYSWSCSNDGITLSSEACVAYDQRCGDGKKNGNEQCDPKDPNKIGRGSDGCSVDCKAKEKDKVPPLCNSEYNGQTFYNHNYPTPIWNPTLNLCSVGTVGNFDGPNYHDPLKKGFYSWTCNGEAGTAPVDCQAKEQRCGDGKKNGNEQCDPNDPSKTGRGSWGCSASCEPVKENPNIDVEKTTLDKDKYYAPGEEVGFKIRFKNTTSSVAKDVIVRDYLPQNLEYVSSQIYGVSPVTSGSYIKDGIFIVEYSGFNLAPSQEGYLYLTGKVKTEHLSDRINTVYVEVEWGIFWDCDTDDYKVEKPGLTIKKTVDKTYVQIGEEVEFRIRVDIKAGSYTGLTIYDDLPIGLAYVPNSQALVDKSSGLAVNQVSFKDSPRLEWKLEFPQRIKKGEFIVLKIRAKVLEADAENAYFNNACIEVPEDPDICEPEDVKISRDLKIKKYVNNKLEDAGKADDKMTFEKDATAYFILEVSDASSPLTGFRVEDTIRGNLNYLDSTDLAENAFTGNIILWENRAVEYTIIPTVTPLVGNETKIVWNVKFTKGSFKPGDKLILKFKAKVLGDQDNIAKVCFTKDNKETEEICRQDPAAVETPKIENLLKIKKYVNDKLEDTGRNDDTMRFSKGTTAYFTIEVAGASNPLTGFRVVDKIPANLVYQNSYDLTNNAFTGVIIFSGSRNPEYKVSVNLSDTSANPEIVWQVDMLGDTFMPGDIFKAQFKAIVNGATTNISHVYYPKRDGTEWTDQDPAAVTIPGGSSGWGGRSGWGGSTPKCGDGYRNGMEMCDMGSNGGMIKGGKMFKNESYVDERYKDKEVFCTSSCMLEELPACFNTQNGSPSIMKGEMLPFYFNLEGVLGKDVKAKDYQDNLKDHFFIWEEGSTICTSKDLNKIDLRSMMCSFEVYGPGKGNSNLVYSGTIPCMNLNGWNDTNGKIYPRIVSFVEQNKNGRFGGSLLNNKGEVKDVFASLDDGWQNYPTLLPFSSKALIKNFGTSNMKIDGAITQKGSTINLFGEYKLSWTKIDFSYCAENGKDKEGNQIYELTKYQEGYPRVCEVDFAVTDHYLIQKSPYGIGTKASEDLSKYQLKNGTKFLDAYSANLKQGGTEYAVSAEVGQTFANFQKKYDKIAVKVKDNLYKVPGKSIYLYKGNDTVDLKNMLWDNVKTAFTFIADKDILIKWNLETNAMIMTKGKIEIDASASCHGRKGQNSTEGQLLQGIFYAGAGFKSVGHEKLKNTVVNLNASERCNYGNLRIQGVVLGDLSDVVANRRSELYTRFEGTGGGTDGKEKADKVLNGGSVVVEYHPNLWSSLPPGAEEFNKVLSVYR